MAQARKCRISGEDFFIRNEDLAFYEAISPVIKGKKYLIPPPTLSPHERERRRLTYRNERKLYKIKSALSNKPIISFYHPNSPWKIYSHDEWWSDSWEALEYSRDFDFSRGFFEQFYEMQLTIPRPPLVNNKAENSDYCNFSDGNRNSYLLTSSNRNQDSYYGFIVADCKDTVDSAFCTNCELVYECLNCTNCYNTNYAQNCENCMDSSFLYNCRGVRNCLMCVNLKNKERYFILNKQSTKEEYEKIMSELNHAEMAKQFEEFKKQFPMKAINTVGCENVVGDDIYNSKNVFLGYGMWNSESCAYSHEGLNASNCQDICFFDGVQWCYESTSLIGYGYRFTNFCRDSADLYYCDNCHSCKNCFGCAGLRRKEYCVLNKQYTKDAYEDLVSKIIPHMEKSGQWGEFFPPKYSLFGYNETLAQDAFPLTKEQALVNGYVWRE